MSKLAILGGTTSYSIQVLLQDSSSATGAGLTALVYNSAGLTCYYARDKGAATAIALATQTATGAFSSGGFVLKDDTNMPGVYRLDVPDAAIASGAKSVVIYFRGATNLVPRAVEIELTATDNQDSTAGGISRLDAAVSSRSTLGGTAQTGDCYARIGAAGASLTALGDSRIANLDAAISTRSTYAGGDTSGTTTLLTRITGAVAPQTGDAYARIGAAGAGLTAIGDARLAYLTGDSYTRLGAAGAGLTALGDTRLGYLTGDAYTRIGAAGAGLTAIGDTRIQSLLDIEQADLWIDTGVTPWAVVWIKKNTGTLGVGTELKRKRLLTTAAGNVTDTTTFIGRTIE